MPRFDPSLLPAAPEARDTRTFNDPNFPEPLTLSLRYSGGWATRQFVTDRTDDLYKEFGPSGKLILLAGEPHPIPISENLCWMIAVLMQGDKPDAGGMHASVKDGMAALQTMEEAWTFQQWAILAHRAGDAFREIFDWADKLREQAQAKNASRATAEISSEPPSDTPASTPIS